MFFLKNRTLGEKHSKHPDLLHVCCRRLQPGVYEPTHPDVHDSVLRSDRLVRHHHGDRVLTGCFRTTDVLVFQTLPHLLLVHCAYDLRRHRRLLLLTLQAKEGK